MLLANFFFHLREETIFFFGNQHPTIFFLCFVEEFFCRMLSLLCRLPFGVFSGQHIFHKFRKQTFFLPTFSTNFFFLTFVATNYFFQFFLGPPPPRYQMVRSLWPITWRLQVLLNDCYRLVLLCHALQTGQIPMTLPGWGRKVYYQESSQYTHVFAKMWGAQTP